MTRSTEPAASPIVDRATKDREREARLVQEKVNANDVVLGIESFGDDDAPLVLLAGRDDDALMARRALRAPRRRRTTRRALRPARQR